MCLISYWGNIIEPMELARVFVLTKDEYDLIGDFVAYYSMLFGHQNVIVVDNGSTHPSVLRTYAKHREKGGVVVSDHRKLYMHHDMLTRVMYEHRKSAKFLIPVDTDEFLYRSDEDIRLDRESIERCLLSLPLDATILRFGSFLGSIVQVYSADYVNQKHERPAAHITQFYNQNWSKVFFRGPSFVSVKQGNHFGQVTGGRTVTVSNLGLLHFHETGPRRTYERCRLSIEGYGHFNIHSSLEYQLGCCRGCEHRLGGHRLVQYQKLLKRMLALKIYMKASDGNSLPSVLLLGKLEALDDIVEIKQKARRWGKLRKKCDVDGMCVGTLLFSDSMVPHVHPISINQVSLCLKTVCA